MTKQKVNYLGKTVHIGIDVHKRTYSVYCLCDDELVKKATVPANPKGLVEFIKKYFPQALVKSAYEAGFSGFVLHRVLIESAISNIVVNPASIEVAAKDKVKTDKRDCQKIAIQLAAGRLRGIHVPTAQQEQARLLSRTREQLVRQKVRLSNQYKSRLHFFGLLPLADTRHISEEFIDHYLEVEMPESVRQSLKTLAKVWKFLNCEIKEIERQMKVQAREDSREKIYRSAPGVGPLTSRILATELGDMSQFPNERALFCHTGLTPCEFSSGDNRRQGHITQQGSARLRWILTEAAWKAINQDPKLRQDFERVAHKRGKKRAIVAIARKMIGRIRACFRKEQEYEIGFGIVA